MLNSLLQHSATGGIGKHCLRLEEKGRVRQVLGYVIIVMLWQLSG